MWKRRAARLDACRPAFERSSALMSRSWRWEKAQLRESENCSARNEREAQKEVTSCSSSALLGYVTSTPSQVSKGLAGPPVDVSCPRALRT